LGPVKGHKNQRDVRPVVSRSISHFYTSSSSFPVGYVIVFPFTTLKFSKEGVKMRLASSVLRNVLEKKASPRQLDLWLHN
jgi:hypothetical protein